MHVAVENGKLIPVTAVARVLPRNWDGSRLMRFLAGLAMLALAFTTPAPAVPATPPVVAVSEQASPTSVTVSDSVAPQADVRVPAAPAVAAAVAGPAVLVPAGGRPALVMVAVALPLTGAALRVPVGRAPPVLA